MKEEDVPGICGVDTRELTKKIREKGTILGRIVYELPKAERRVQIADPNMRNLVEEVSIRVRNFVLCVVSYMFNKMSCCLESCYLQPSGKPTYMRRGLRLEV